MTGHGEYRCLEPASVLFVRRRYHARCPATICSGFHVAVRAMHSAELLRPILTSNRTTTCAASHTRPSRCSASSIQFSACGGEVVILIARGMRFAHKAYHPRHPRRIARAPLTSLTAFPPRPDKPQTALFRWAIVLIHVTPFHTVSWAASKTPEVASATPMRHPVTSAILMNIKHLRK